MRKLTIIATAISLSLGLSACSDQKTVEESIIAAEQAVQKKDLGTAVIELKNAIVENPNNGQVRALLGDVYVKQGYYVAAEKELERAVRLGVTGGVIPQLSLSKLKLGKYDDVLALLEENNSASDEDYMLLLVYAGVASIQTGDLAQGQDFFSQAISLNEEAIYGQMAKAYLAQTKSDYQAALQIVDQILANVPETAEALLLKGNLQYGMEDYEQAATTFAQYIENKPRALYVKYFQIKSLLKAEQYDEAESHADWLLARLKDAPLANQYKAQIEYQKGNYVDAKLFAEKAAQAGSQFTIAKMVAGLSAYQLNNVEQAYAHLRPLEQYVGSDHPIKKVLAIVKLELGYTDEALASINDISDSDVDFLEIASVELSNQGNIPTALSILNRAEALAPQNAQIKAQKGMLMLKAGDDSGVAALEEALALDSSLVDVETALALEYLQQDEDGKVKALIEKQLDTESSKIRGLLLQGARFSKLNQHNLAKDVFNQILEIEPENIAANFNLAVYALDDKNYQEAISLYQQVLTKSPNHQKAVQGLLRSHTGNKSLGEAVNFLASLTQSNNYPSYTTLGLATAYRLLGEYQSIISLIANSAINESQYTLTHHVMLGDSHMALGQLEKAKEVYQEGLKRFNGNYVLALREVGIFELQKDYANALIKIDGALKRFPESTSLKLLKANMTYMNGNHDEAKQYVAKLNDEHIVHPLLSSLNGHFAFENRDLEKAAEHYFEAYQANPNRLNTLTLARALNGQGKQLEAAELLENYVGNVQDSVMELLLAELYTKFDIEKAIVYYTSLVNKSPEDPMLLNNLAWQLYSVKRYSEAFKHIEKAKQLSPNDENIQDTYQKISENL